MHAIGRNNLDKDLATYAAVKFIYLRRFKREVLIAAILQLGRVHTHISFVTTHVITRLAATVVSCISNIQSFTELTALTLNKSNNDRWDYGFPHSGQLKSKKLISLARYLGHHSAFRDGKRYGTDESRNTLSKCTTRPATLRIESAKQRVIMSSAAVTQDLLWGEALRDEPD